MIKSRVVPVTILAMVIGFIGGLYIAKDPLDNTTTEYYLCKDSEDVEFHRKFIFSGNTIEKFYSCVHLKYGMRCYGIEDYRWFHYLYTNSVNECERLE